MTSLQLIGGSWCLSGLLSSCGGNGGGNGGAGGGIGCGLGVIGGSEIARGSSILWMSLRCLSILVWVGNVQSFFSGHCQCCGVNIQAAVDHHSRFTCVVFVAPGVTQD